jgi:hypothetical protein
VITIHEQKIKLTRRSWDRTKSTGAEAFVSPHSRRRESEADNRATHQTVVILDRAASFDETFVHIAWSLGAPPDLDFPRPRDQLPMGGGRSISGVQKVMRVATLPVAESSQKDMSGLHGVSH